MARPRGFATWSPQAETEALLDDVRAVCEENAEHLPLTARQVFYMLVGQYGFAKTEQAYARLCEHLVRARRAGMIHFDTIRDDGTATYEPPTWASVDGWWDDIRKLVRRTTRDRAQSQPVAIELWCEAAGMAPQLARAAWPYSVPVYSTGGFSSVTVTHELAARVLRRAVPTVFLHVGDFDPSGESIFTAMSTDAKAFVDQVVFAATTYDDPEHGIALGSLMGLDEEEVDAIVTGHRQPALRPVRVALTEEQVEEHDLPTAPPKRSDTRSRNWYSETCQLEAMPPDLLAETVREAIVSRMDTLAYSLEIQREETDREAIAAVLDEAV